MKSLNLLTAQDIAILDRNSLLTRADSNGKTAKLRKTLGLEACILHLAPSWNSGYGTCPMASTGCAMACLYSAGHGGIVKAGQTVSDVNQARIRKTRFFMERRAEFLAKLVRETESLIARAIKSGLTPSLRLNATSDILWETIPVIRGGIVYPSMMAAFPEVQFYDYTKVITRLTRTLPANYHLTFSLSESNDTHASQAAILGHNVAAVLRVAKGQPMPDTFLGMPVIDGDEHDYRFLDPRGVIVGLRPKGRNALKDTSGFVHDVDYRLQAIKPQFATKSTFAMTRVD